MESCSLFCVLVMFIGSINWGRISGCKIHERNALINFNQSLAYNLVSPSWDENERNCCRWARVTCDNHTGHVVQLHLNASLTFNNSEYSLQYLVELNHLEHLDLSWNDFNNNPIPRVIGSMKQLRYLNLSNNYDLTGLVPHELGNLTNLQLLDISHLEYPIKSMTLKWVTGLRKLEYLDMSYVDLSKAHDWLQSLIGQLPSLRELKLSRCRLPAPFTPSKNPFQNASVGVSLIHHLDLRKNHLETFPLFIQNLTFLEYLDLSRNQFSDKIPYWLGQLHRLDIVYFGHNIFTGIEGGLWNILGNLCRLRTLAIERNSLRGNLFQPRENLTRCPHHDLDTLTLSENEISGSIPAWLGETFSGLNKLDLSRNNLTGHVPASLGMLTSLKLLDLSDNQLRGTILTQVHFGNLKTLTHLYLDNTFIEIKLPSNWTPPFQLQELGARACHINDSFPPWLQTQKNLSFLDLSYSGISGEIPKWFHGMERLVKVYLSHNQITGPPVFPKNFGEVHLSNNLLQGPIIKNDSHVDTYESAGYLDLSNNLISGPVPENLHRSMWYLVVLILSHNQLNGSIPSSLGRLTELEILDLQKNMLTGTIPNCWENSTGLQFIRLSSNRLVGHIPCSFQDNIQYMHLDDNNLYGQIPRCLNKLSDLTVLDLSGNKLSGHIPVWVNGKFFWQLKVLKLRVNQLKGVIPSELCSVSSLLVLDLGNNNFTGTIPQCVGHLTQMTSLMDAAFEDSGAAVNDLEDVQLVMKRLLLEYSHSFQNVMAIDFSSNNLVGSIPKEITKLKGLQGLNFSYNRLTGRIPDNIGDLKSLESLDLSYNNLSGMIPQSFSALTQLSSLNMSYNNLQGQIPTCTPLQTRDQNAYIGNPRLWGCPLPTKCSWYPPPQPPRLVGSQKDDDKEDQHEQMWFYIVIMLGVATGFWGVIGTLLLKKSWRHAYFQTVEEATDWVYVRIIARVRVIFKRLCGSKEP